MEQESVVEKGRTDGAGSLQQSVWTLHGKRLFLTVDFIDASGNADHFWPSHCHHLTTLCLFFVSVDFYLYYLLGLVVWQLYLFRLVDVFGERFRLADLLHFSTEASKKVSCFKAFV